MTDEAAFEFYIKQASAVYPQVTGGQCRLSRIRVLRFPGVHINDVILYQVQVKTKDGWVTVPTRNRLDYNWFGFVRKPTVLSTSDVLGVCHRHFLKYVLSGNVSVTIREYLALYKKETVYPMQLTQSDGTPVVYWDSMLVRALELKDVGTYAERQYGSVKVRKQWQIGEPEPVEPQRTGVLFNTELTEHTLTTLQQRMQAAVRHPGVFVRGRPLTGARLEIFHTTQPGG